MSRLFVIRYWVLGRRGCGALRLGCLILFLAAGVFAVAPEVSAPEAAAPVDPVAAALDAYRAGRLSEAETLLEEIRNPAAKYFVQACIEQATGDPDRAIQTLVKGIVRCPNDPDWIAKSELMSVVLYMEMGMLDAADVTARQIQMIYEGTDFATKATALRSQIDQLKKEMDEKGITK